MNFNRRSFIKTTGSAALAGVLSHDVFGSQVHDDKKGSNKPLVVIFLEAGFPEGEISFPGRDAFGKELQKFDVRFLTVEEIKEQLLLLPVDVFVNPYGSSFPRELWGTMYQYLKAGGNWVNVGGVPFSIPVVREGKEWRREIHQVAYHKKLGITQSFPVKVSGLKSENPLKIDIQSEEVFELYLRLANTRDFPAEDGSAGSRDANVKALSFYIDDHQRRVAAPVIEIDRMQGEFAGGRWVLANFTGTLSPESLRIMIDRAVEGAMELSARSAFASYYPGETPSFTISLKRPKGLPNAANVKACTLEVQDNKNRVIEKVTIRFSGSDSIAFARASMSTKNLPKGFYSVNVNVILESPVSHSTFSLLTTNGFWVYDKELLEGGSPFSTNETFLLRDGKPYPVTGTTYMGSDVHRKFLFEPNPYLWNIDFKEMKESGINMVRTGIWTGWRNYMLDPGSMNETAMRAFDAFLLTARKYDIPVIFTFFAFLPEMWGGENPYLDPRSIAAQKEFISAFSQRYSRVNDLVWDFINEPSFCNPGQLWSTRPNYDRFESEAWVSWLKKKYKKDSIEELIVKLQEVYRTPDNVLSLPVLTDFNDVNIFNENQPVKVIDYRLFAQEMFNQWVVEMTKAIRSGDNSTQLITVGQDEGGTYERPGPQFYCDNVDFTSVHNWWFNDDLLWDSIVTKSPLKPNLVEETGVMFYEKMDGSPWRSEQEVASLLERKLAIALCANSAGFIEWIWNTNPYMKSDNESAIGLHRADGTAKPELEPLMKYAKFLSQHKQLMVEKKEEEVTMLIPHSQMFSTRNFATQATQQCVNAMVRHCRFPMNAVSEYSLKSLKKPPKLLVVPSPGVLNEEAWVTMLSYVEQGMTLLISGVIDFDEHWMPVSRSRNLGFESDRSPVAPEETFLLNGEELRVRYRGDKLQRIEKAVYREASREVKLINKGRGQIIWCPLPVELAEEIAPTVVLYSLALQQASLQPPFRLIGSQPNVLIISTEFQNAFFLTVISNTDTDSNFFIALKDAKEKIEVGVKAMRTNMLVIEKSSGKIISKFD